MEEKLQLSIESDIIMTSGNLGIHNSVSIPSSVQCVSHSLSVGHVECTVDNNNTTNSNIKQETTTSNLCDTQNTEDLLNKCDDSISSINNESLYMHHLVVCGPLRSIEHDHGSYTSPLSNILNDVKWKSKEECGGIFVPDNNYPVEKYDFSDVQDEKSQQVC